MASAERESITGSGGGLPSPQQGQGVTGAKAPEAERLLKTFQLLDAQRKLQICLIFRILQTH